MDALQKATAKGKAKMTLASQPKDGDVQDSGVVPVTVIPVVSDNDNHDDNHDDDDTTSADRKSVV